MNEANITTGIAGSCSGAAGVMTNTPPRWAYCPADGKYIEHHWNYCPLCGRAIGTLPLLALTSQVQWYNHGLQQINAHEIQAGSLPALVQNLAQPTQ